MNTNMKIMMHTTSCNCAACVPVPALGIEMPYDIKENCLAVACPKVAAMLSEKDKHFAFEVTVGSRREFTFVCPDCGQEFKARIYSIVKTVKNSSTGCPVCAGRKVIQGINDLASQCPRVATMLSKKDKHFAFEVAAGSRRKLTFVCPDCKQVNCRGAMGAGLALQIRNRWPVVYRRYLGLCYGGDGNKLGTYQEILVEPKLYIVNLFGQDGYGRSERQTNYAALATALFSFFRDCAQKNQDAIIRLPYGLGCGLAGGDWDTVLDIISDAAKAWNLNVEIWELQK